MPAAPYARSGAPPVSTGRRVRNGAWWGLCAAGFGLVAVPVVWVIAYVVTKAAASWSWSIFTKPVGATYQGLLNTIEGTFLMMVGVALIAGVIGIGTGIWLSEVAKPGALRSILRGASEVLSGIPSIVLGYVGYLALVVNLHWGYSLLPALITLSFLVVPYIAKATELALSQVPLAYREGGEALGMRRTHVLGRIVLRSAIPGISTGLILALAISVGETAPLLYTAGFTSGYWDGAFLGPAATSQMPYLTYATWTFYQVPTTQFKNALPLSFDAALLLMVLVLGLILLARLVVRLTQKYSPERATGISRAALRAAKANRLGSARAAPQA